MLYLPSVTLVIVDTTRHDLAWRAVEDSVKGIQFGDCVTFSNMRLNDWSRWVDVNITSKDEWGRFVWYALPYHITTSHVLLIQWDGFVINPQAWDNKFLEYDYIGAPWSHLDMMVGNGGFSLRSMKLLKHIASEPGKYVYNAPEDQVLCRVYEPELRNHGFKFADVKTASKFSCEGVYVPGTFGFHSARNFPYVLTKEALEKRLVHASVSVESGC